MRFYIIAFLVFLVACESTPKVEFTEQKKTKPQILAVYPSSDTLPENLLRFYVQFSKSMKAVNNLENIKLINEEGQEIKGAIFNNVYELWDKEQKQLTLILDPSRVKTGLITHNNLGRALKHGKQFKLVIEKAVDIYGNETNEPFLKSFHVIKADRKMPDVSKWIVTSPKAGTKNSVILNFPQILDRMSLLNKIRIKDANNEIIKGTIEIVEQEKQWEFYPKNKWKKGSYSIQVSSRLEDPSGNNLNGLFDHKLGDLKSDTEGEIVKQKFEIL